MYVVELSAWITMPKGRKHLSCTQIWKYSTFFISIQVYDRWAITDFRSQMFKIPKCMLWHLVNGAYERMIVSLTRALLVFGVERAGPGGVEPPLCRLLGHVMTFCKRHSEQRENSWRNCSVILRSGQRSGRQRSLKSNSALFNIFLQMGT